MGDGSGRAQEADYTDVDAVFCCLPHGTTQQIVRELPSSVKVVDLSADFRLRDVDTYAEWYGGAHQATELQKEVCPLAFPVGRRATNPSPPLTPSTHTAHALPVCTVYEGQQCGRVLLCEWMCCDAERKPKPFWTTEGRVAGPGARGL